MVAAYAGPATKPTPAMPRVSESAKRNGEDRARPRQNGLPGLSVNPTSYLNAVYRCRIVRQNGRNCAAREPKFYPVICHLDTTPSIRKIACHLHFCCNWVALTRSLKTCCE
jgi:hypothetical protein